MIKTFQKIIKWIILANKIERKITMHFSFCQAYHCNDPATDSNRKYNAIKQQIHFRMAKHVDPVIEKILRADHLSEETRQGYTRRLALIAAAAGNKALIPILTLHSSKVLECIMKQYQEVGTQRTMIVAVLAAYKL